jgi:LysR family transcriptional regulator, low CO2-responsive transcriptional regulator
VTLTQLRVFAMVVRCGSVSAAAAELGVGPSTISEAMAGLRRELDDPLYVRREGRLVLTAGGRELAARATQIVRLTDDAPHAVAQARGAVPPRLRIAASTAFSELALTPVLAAFRRARPRLEVHAEVARVADFCELLESGTADLALGPPAGPPAPARRIVRILRLRLAVVVGPRHPLAARATVDAAELTGQQWLAGPEGDEPGEPVQAVPRRWGVSAGPRVMPSSAEALQQVADGAGVAIVPAHVVSPDVRAGRLVELTTRPAPPVLHWCASARPRERSPREAEELLRFLVSPEATRALVTRGASAAPPPRPSVYVTIWSA